MSYSYMLFNVYISSCFGGRSIVLSQTEKPSDKTVSPVPIDRSIMEVYNTQSYREDIQ